MEPREILKFLGGWGLCVLGVAHTFFKLLMIRDVARDPYNGGGAPTLDFVIVIPAWFSWGISIMLTATHHHPFPFFGFLLYVILVFVFYGILIWEYKRGEPEKKENMKKLEKYFADEEKKKKNRKRKKRNK